MLRVLMSFLLLLVALCAQETVRLQAADGQKLTGTLTRPPVGVALRGGVVLLHMHRSNRTAWAPFATRLAACGLASVALDLRGHGDSSTNEQGAPIQVPREAAPDHPAAAMHDDVAAAHAALLAAGVPARAIVWAGAELGATVALHAAAVNPAKPAALLLLTPLKNICGLDALADAPGATALPALVLSADEDAELGARPLVQALGAKAKLRCISQQGILGTRMLGRVTGLEADLLSWIDEALSAEIILDIPLVRGVILDGETGAAEEEGSTVLTVALPGVKADDHRQARIRLARNRSKLLFGMDIPERYLHNNAVTVFIDASGKGPSTPDAQCFSFEIRPQSTTHELRVLRGGDGAWKPVTLSGLQSYVRTNAAERWTAELAVPLELLALAENAELRVAFRINGQKKDTIVFHPAGVGMEVTPRRWLRAKLR